MKRYLIGIFILALAAGIVVSLKPLLKLIYPIPYAESIYKHSTANGLDAFLVAAVIKVESDFDHKAVSPKGAVGLMQILPSTGEWAASKAGMGRVTAEDLRDAGLNIKVGTWYLASLVEQFDGDIVLALAAYNGGGGNVTKWLETNEWSGEWLTVDEIPFGETRDFVKRVMGYYDWFSYVYDGRFPSEPAR